MVRNSVVRWCAVFLGFIFFVCSGIAANPRALTAEPRHGQATQDQTTGAPSFKIMNEGKLADTFPHADYEVRFTANGGVPPLHWQLEKGGLPPGIKLEGNGLLHGRADRAGEFQFTVSATDANQPQVVIQKEFLLRVRSALTLVWKNPARVNGNRIEGSASVSNTTPDDIDLTFIVMAVAENGRATAIGYQRFNLAHGTVEMELPFGETLPHGGYVIHVDAVGEVAEKNLIYRERMQTPGRLQVTVGP